MKIPDGPILHPRYLFHCVAGCDRGIGHIRCRRDWAVFVAEQKIAQAKTRIRNVHRCRHESPRRYHHGRSGCGSGYRFGRVRRLGDGLGADAANRRRLAVLCRVHRRGLGIRGDRDPAGAGV
jgi:hypothetical protein